MIEVKQIDPNKIIKKKDFYKKILFHKEKKIIFKK